MPVATENMTSQEILDAEQPTGVETQTEEAPREGTENTAGKSEQTVGGDSSWNAKEWQLKFRDQTIVPKDKHHLVSLAQQGYSYSQRMHELKQREDQLNGKSQQYDQYAKLEAAFEKNPGFREKLMQWYQDSLTPGTAPTATAAPSQSSIPPELLKEIQDLKGWKAEWEKSQQEQKKEKADQEIHAEVESLKSKYARDDWDTPSSNGLTLAKEVMKHAYELGGVKLETAYRDLMWDSHTKSAEITGIKKATENQAAAKKAGVVSGGKSRGASPAAPVNTAEMGYDQIAKLVQQDYGIQS